MTESGDAGVLDDEFAVPDDLEPLIEEVHEFIETEVKPVEREYREYLGDPLTYLDADAKLRPEVHAAQATVREKAGDAGLYALHMPESVGGGGLSQRVTAPASRSRCSRGPRGPRPP